MNIALIGYDKMGRMIEKIAQSRGHRICCIIDIDNQDDFNSEAFRSADVAIEFTAPNAAYKCVSAALDRDVKVVTGTTGWLPEQLEEIRRRCQDDYKTVFRSSNFSLGVFLFGKLNAWLARLMNGYESYDVSMSETHHVHKKDAPSGTAITLAESIIENLDRKTSWTRGKLVAPNGVTPAPHEPGPQEIAIDSIREGEEVGTHSVSYETAFDTICIRHSLKDRAALALGAVIAAEFAATHEGWLGMDDMISE